MSASSRIDNLTEPVLNVSPPFFPSCCPHHESLITSADQRMNVEQIKNHAFFYGVDWPSIRQIDAPFVPRLRSITDTSYFPVDDLEQNGADEAAAADANDSSKDLAFLGYAPLLFSWSFHHGVYSFFVDIRSNASTSPVDRSLFTVKLPSQQLVCRKGSLICPDLRVQLIIAIHTYP